MTKLVPLRPLPIGMREYSLILVLTTSCRDLAADAVMQMCKQGPWPAMRHVSTEKHDYLTTLKVRFGAYDDDHAKTVSGGAVRASMAAGKVQGVALLQQGRFIVTAHSTMR